MICTAFVHLAIILVSIGLIYLAFRVTLSVGIPFSQSCASERLTASVLKPFVI
jgi:hypothetical protein